ncbi:MAG: Ig domain-containing protein [Planctomycetota bacterium]
MRRLVFIALLAAAFLAGCGGGSSSTPVVESYPPESITYPAFGPFMIGSPINPISPVITGGVPDTWVVSPAFPDGVLLDPETGVISGTPLEIQTPTPHTIFAENSNGQVTHVVLIYVLPAPPCEIQYGADSFQLLHGMVSEPLTPVSGCGAAELWSIFPQLPAGLSFNPATGTISGTPLVVSDATEYVVTASNTVGSNSSVLTIEVIGTPPCDLLYPVSFIGMLVGDILDPLVPDVGCGPIVEFSVTPALPAGLHLDVTSGVISGVANAVSPQMIHYVTASNASGSTTFPLIMRIDPQAPCQFSYPTSLVTVELHQIFEVLLPAVSCGTVEIFSVEPALPLGITLDATSGQISGVAEEISESRNYIFSASNVTGESSFAVLIEVVSPPPCNLSYSETELNMTVGEPMSLLVPSVSCGAVEIYEIFPDLPGGIELDPFTGVFFGTPSEVSPENLYEIQASNSQGSVSTLLWITVVPEAPCDLQYPNSEVVLTVAEEMVPLVPDSGCGLIENYTAIPPLPLGISLDNATGIISGTPLFPNDQMEHLIMGGNGNGWTTFSISFTVLPQAPCAVSYPLDTLILEPGESIGLLEPVAACGTPEFWEVVPPLPNGMAMDSNTGTITGAPLGVHDLQLHFISAVNISGSSSFGLSIWVQEEPPCDVIYPEPHLSLLQGEAMVTQEPSSGCGSVDFYEISPTLPAGLQLDPINGSLSGTPLEALVLTDFQIWALNDSGSATTSVSLEVIGQAPCAVAYPQEKLAHPAGVPLSPQIPISECGPPELWTAIPPLPLGLVIDPVSGAISGTALQEGSSSHIIRAENSFGSTEMDLEILIRPVFHFRGGGMEIPYSSVSGEGSGSLTLFCEEGDLNPGFPTALSGLSMAIQHDSSLFTYASSSAGGDVAILNGGEGPDFWAVHSIEGTMLIGFVVSFTADDFLICAAEREIVTINFDTVPEFLQGNSMGISGALEWGNPSGSPPLDNLVVVDGADSVDPVMETIYYDLIPQ